MEHTCKVCGMKFPKKSLLLTHQRHLGHTEQFDCAICRKKFGRKYNYDRHVARHADGSLYQCDECGTLFSRNDRLQNHKLQHHNQTGGGLKRKSDNSNEDLVKRRLTKNDVPNEFYDLRIINERNIPNFRTKATRYKVTFKDLEVRD